jgi:hypothetical protein
MLYVVNEAMLETINPAKHDSFMLAILIELKESFDVSVAVEKGSSEISGFHFVGETSTEFQERITAAKSKILALKNLWSV